MTDKIDFARVQLLLDVFHQTLFLPNFIELHKAAQNELRALSLEQVITPAPVVVETAPEQVVPVTPHAIPSSQFEPQPEFVSAPTLMTEPAPSEPELPLEAPVNVTRRV